MYKVIGGMPVGADGKVHTTFSHNPSTLRLASNSPNLQNLPRTNAGELQALVRNMFVTPEGYTFWARDFSGIEAVVVGYFAYDADYIRLAKLGVHDFYNANMLAQTGKIGHDNVPSLSLSDADLKVAFKELKKAFPVERDTAKRVVHLSNYLGTPSRMHKEYPETFKTVKQAAKLQGFYFELFPKIPAWHGGVCLAVDGVNPSYQPPAGAVGPGWIRNPFGGLHRFWNVIEWKSDSVWAYGDAAKQLIAYDPQATASAIMKYSLLSLWAYPLPLAQALSSWKEEGLDKHPKSWVGETLRLSVHDEILGIVREGQLTEKILEISEHLMERKWFQLPLDKIISGSVDYLNIGTEAKVGNVWGEMK